jgi:hypothetical protein
MSSYSTLSRLASRLGTECMLCSGGEIVLRTCVKVEWTNLILSEP